MGGHDSAQEPKLGTLLFSTAAKNSAKIVRMRVCLARCASLLSIASGWTLLTPTLVGRKVVCSWRALASSSLLNVRHPVSALSVLHVRLLQCLQYMRLHRRQPTHSSQSRAVADGVVTHRPPVAAISAVSLSRCIHGKSVSQSAWSLETRMPRQAPGCVRLATFCGALG